MPRKPGTQWTDPASWRAWRERLNAIRAAKRAIRAAKDAAKVRAKLDAWIELADGHAPDR